MLEILLITGPIFTIIGLGFAAVRLEWFTRADIRVMGRFVISIALPALLFRALSERDFTEIMNLRFIAGYALGSLAAMAIGFSVARFGQKRSLQASALRGLGMSASNSGFIGYPIVVQFLGPTAAVAMALTMTVENLLMSPLALGVAEAGMRDSGGRPARAVVLAAFAQLLRNPLIIAIIAGFTCSMLDLRAPAPVSRAIEMLAAASAPVALFVIGGTLVGLKPGRMVGDISQVVLGKLILHPLAVLAMFLFIPHPEPTLFAAALAFASMPMMSIYPILAQRYGEDEVCAAALLATTVASFASISGSLWLIRSTLMS
ncbi:AEC family transporter [Noviherbaspirillum denitrificans]|uniref:Permease n=1 Tax=Noviherbaspirillum denitrificans TaxID=1968433 RepID=A0A254TLX9_9BURK|nr:AEC family transporter [Noviherbaspirillum denitrificans]OWW21623.1 permease [Noviherbaspirillum denitrificans]